MIIPCRYIPRSIINIPSRLSVSIPILEKLIPAYHLLSFHPSFMSLKQSPSNFSKPHPRSFRLVSKWGHFFYLAITTPGCGLLRAFVTNHKAFIREYCFPLAVDHSQLIAHHCMYMYGTVPFSKYFGMCCANFKSTFLAFSTFSNCTFHSFIAIMKRDFCTEPRMTRFNATLSSLAPCTVVYGTIALGLPRPSSNCRNYRPT